MNALFLLIYIFLCLCLLKKKKTKGQSELNELRSPLFDPSSGLCVDNARKVGSSGLGLDSKEMWPVSKRGG